MDSTPSDDFASEGMRVYSVKLFFSYPRWYGSQSYTRDVEVEAPPDASPSEIVDIATTVSGIQITSPPQRIQGVITVSAS